VTPTIKANSRIQVRYKLEFRQAIEANDSPASEPHKTFRCDMTVELDSGQTTVLFPGKVLSGRLPESMFVILFRATTGKDQLANEPVVDLPGRYVELPAKR
jgi:hypothetical protein